MKTSPTNKKVRELITLVREEKLIPRPEFQRRLVWSRNDKNHFLDSVLRGYPFPEIYLADGIVDLETGKGTQQLVDGLQRVSTLIQYFEGDSDLKLTTIPPYKELGETEKKNFLNYDVAVRDLGSITIEEIVEVFQRINATKYSLLDIEVNNAVYSGALKKYAYKIASNKLFDEYRVFNSLDLKRMGDLRFALGITITLMAGYFNRDELFGDFLERFNDDFPAEVEVETRFNNVTDLISECGLSPKSRAWRKADLFTLIVELDQIINVQRKILQPIELIERLEDFYSSIDSDSIDSTGPSGIYYKAALQASNDKLNRVRRGYIIYGVLAGVSTDETMKALKSAGLI